MYVAVMSRNDQGRDTRSKPRDVIICVGVADVTSILSTVSKTCLVNWPKIVLAF